MKIFRGEIKTKMVLEHDQYTGRTQHFLKYKDIFVFVWNLCSHHLQKTSHYHIHPSWSSGSFMSFWDSNLVCLSYKQLLKYSLWVYTPTPLATCQRRDIPVSLPDWLYTTDNNSLSGACSGLGTIGISMNAFISWLSKDNSMLKQDIPKWPQIQPGGPQLLLF